MIKVSAFRWVPPFARGLVRDLRVRWALEEVGMPYQARLIGPDDQKSKSYRAMQPFGQVPAFEDDNLVLFESGAILLHIAEQSDVLMPSDPKARARTTAWMFAAVNSVEPDGDRPLSRGPGMGQATPPRCARPRANAPDGLVGLAQRPRLPGGSLHGRRSSDDDRAEDPAPNRFGCANADARSLSSAMRSTARVQEGIESAIGGFRR